MREKQTPIENIVAFCILMENNEGILNKSPSYIREKFSRYIEREDDPEEGLDLYNRIKLERYRQRWGQRGV